MDSQLCNNGPFSLNLPTSIISRLDKTPKCFNAAYQCHTSEQMKGQIINRMFSPLIPNLIESAN